MWVKISFVIPAYNEEKRLPACLTSIQEALKSGSYDAEVIVVNNASTDRTTEVALSFPGVKVVDEPQKGLVRARAAGFRASTGEIIANVDADTVLPKAWLPTVLDAFEKHPHLVGFSGPYIYTDLSVTERMAVRLFYALGYVMYLANRFVFHSGSMMQGGNYVVRRAALEKIGGYDTSIEFYGEDTDIARRLATVGDVVWTFRLPMYSSGRRLAHEGIFTMGYKYALNLMWVNTFGKPYTSKYIDVRHH